MRPFQVNHYVTWFIAASSILLIAICGRFITELNQLETAANETHQQAAVDELQRNIQNLLKHTDDLLNHLANWDETKQQLHDPSYYHFWRLRRVHAVYFIPKYITAIELYSTAGDILRSAKDTQLPDRMPKLRTYISEMDGRYYLFVYRRILQDHRAQSIKGYVATKIDFFRALSEVGHFYHIDFDSLTLEHWMEQEIPIEYAYDLLRYKELHDKEQLQLIRLAQQMLWSTIGLLSVILLTFYLLANRLFRRPIRAIHDYMQTIGQNQPRQASIDPPALPVTELNQLAQALSNYYQALRNTQQNLEQLNTALEQRVEDRTHELQQSNKALESFAYSISHDLRTPLRSLAGYSHILEQEHAEQLDEQALHYLQRIRLNAVAMSQLIDDLLQLSRVTRKKLVTESVNLSELALRFFRSKLIEESHREVEYVVLPDLHVSGDKQLLKLMLENILSNAWKFSSLQKKSIIEFGKTGHRSTKAAFYVKDNGVGFDMRYYDKLFLPFHPLHGSEFAGSGIGLATAERIIAKHGGAIWARSEPGLGATFFFHIN